MHRAPVWPALLFSRHARSTARAQNAFEQDNMPRTWKGIPLRAPCALDLYCGGGGAGRGLLDAGFKTVVGVDRENHRSSYEHADGMHFVHMDVTQLADADLALFDFVWASPPCQAYSRIIPASQRELHQERWRQEGRHADMVPLTRALLQRSGKPYIIENVVGAPLQNPVTLCGTMFGLSVFRHRLFESNVPLVVEHKCDHRNRSTGSLMNHVRKPQTEKYVARVTSDQLPPGFAQERVQYPCRPSDRSDYVYRATTDETRAALQATFKRTYARSLKEVSRVVGALVPMTPDEVRADEERVRTARQRALKPGEQQMFPVYGAHAASRGSTEEWRAALGCPWMYREELAQAIPPAYSKYLAAQVLRHMAARQNGA